PYLSGLPRLTNEVIILLTLFTLTGVIGFIDDFLIVKNGKNNGLKARHKLAGQLIIAALFGIYLLKNNFNLMVSPLLYILGMNQPFLYVLLSSFIVIGVSNAVNLADGLDGLASGVSMIVFLAFAFIAWQFNNPQLMYLALFAAIACLGFLVFNIHPAKMFMGDVGSLALGTLLAGFALLLHAELYLALAGIWLIWETVSVILQVGYFKLTKGRRLFKMSPFHHHLELCGWPEKKIVRTAWLLTAGAVLLAVIFRIR
ncbi:MAG: phospho-N-acetylmuramoyl-pentapeptide-transferase, partial [Candidatus Margulisbacteria bacterium]|nr:phospho-N-acetylmuramoyl-pentapeptide-transferase [Candidatus Margulisiibacteriota bacterium]